MCIDEKLLSLDWIQRCQKKSCVCVREIKFAKNMHSTSNDLESYENFQGNFRYQKKPASIISGRLLTNIAECCFYTRGRKLSLIKYFFHCTICIWLCNNNENWKQIFYACERTRNFLILTICDSITFSRAHYSGIACNENQILSLEREWGVEWVDVIIKYMFFNMARHLCNSLLSSSKYEAMKYENSDINIWLQYLYL